MNEAWRGQQEQENKVIYESRINRQSLTFNPSMYLHVSSYPFLAADVFT